MTLDARIPSGPIEQAWDKARFDMKLVNPANKRKHNVIVVGSGLAGASAAASLGELGYRVQCFCFQDSPRRAHSIAAQGGINAAKNYPNDGESVFRLFYDTVKGGDFRAREANVYRLAQNSLRIIDQCVAQGVPFAREYGGSLTNRSFGGAQVSRTFYARGQTGQQLLLGAYQALERQVRAGTVKMIPRTEMLDLIVIDGRARGIVTRNLVTGKLDVHIADAVILATGGYGNVYYLSTNAKGSNTTAIWRAHKRGALFANPCFTQIHPTCIPVSGDYQSKLTLMSESLRNDGRIWVPKKKGDQRSPDQIPEDERDYYLERRYPSFGNLVPRDVASRNAKAVCDEGRGVGKSGLGVYLDFSEAIVRVGEKTIRERYGNLFDMYQRITDEDQNDRPAPIHGARSVRRVDGLLARIPHGPRFFYAQRQLHRCDHMQRQRSQQRQTHHPQQLAQAVQQVRVGIDALAPFEDLQIAEHVANHEEKHDGPGDGHNSLLAGRRLPQARHAPYGLLRLRYRYACTHLFLSASFLFCLHCPALWRE